MNSIELRNNPWFKNNPLIAILRGVESNEIVELARKLIEHEFRLIEIPLNSPNGRCCLNNLNLFQVLRSDPL